MRRFQFFGPPFISSITHTHQPMQFLPGKFGRRFCCAVRSACVDYLSGVCVFVILLSDTFLHVAATTSIRSNWAASVSMRV